MFEDILNGDKRTTKLIINFSQNLVDDPDARFVMFHGDSFNTQDASVICDINGNHIEGFVDQKRKRFEVWVDKEMYVVIVAMGLYIAGWVSKQGCLKEDIKSKFYIIARAMVNYRSP